MKPFNHENNISEVEHSGSIYVTYCGNTKLSSKMKNMQNVRHPSSRVAVAIVKALTFALVSIA
jgi:hypothetical protein